MVMPVEVPGPYLMLIRMRRHGQMDYWYGGYAAQPELRYLEFEQCILAENDHRIIERKNEELKREFEANKAGNESL